MDKKFGSLVEKYYAKVEELHDPSLFNVILLTFRKYTEPPAMWEFWRTKYERASSHQREDLVKVLNIWVADYISDFLRYSVCREELTQTLDLLPAARRQAIQLGIVKALCSGDELKVIRPLANKRNQHKGLSNVTITPIRKFGTFRMMSPLSSPTRKRLSTRIIAESTGLDTLSADEIAAALTIQDFELLKQVKPLELLSKAGWNMHSDDESTPNINKMIEHFNEISFWVVTEIVSKSGEQQKIIIRKFVDIAFRCLAIGNFNASVNILSGLNNSSVSRLKQSWDNLGSKHADKKARLDEVYNQQGGFKNYNNELEKRSLPIIPYFPLLLRDITFIIHGNSGYTEDGNINEDVINLLQNRVDFLKKYQVVGFSELEAPDEVLRYLQNLTVIRDDEALYRLSVKSQPSKAAQRILDESTSSMATASSRSVENSVSESQQEPNDEASTHDGATFAEEEDDQDDMLLHPLIKISQDAFVLNLFKDFFPNEASALTFFLKVDDLKSKAEMNVVNSKTSAPAKQEEENSSDDLPGLENFTVDLEVAEKIYKKYLHKKHRLKCVPRAVAKEVGEQIKSGAAKLSANIFDSCQDSVTTHLMVEKLPELFSNPLYVEYQVERNRWNCEIGRLMRQCFAKDDFSEKGFRSPVDSSFEISSDSSLGSTMLSNSFLKELFHNYLGPSKAVLLNFLLDALKFADGENDHQFAILVQNTKKRREILRVETQRFRENYKDPSAKALKKHELQEKEMEHLDVILSTCASAMVDNVTKKLFGHYQKFMKESDLVKYYKQEYDKYVNKLMVLMKPSCDPKNSYSIPALAETWYQQAFLGLTDNLPTTLDEKFKLTFEGKHVILKKTFKRYLKEEGGNQLFKFARLMESLKQSLATASTMEKTEDKEHELRLLQGTFREVFVKHVFPEDRDFAASTASSQLRHAYVTGSVVPAVVTEKQIQAVKIEVDQSKPPKEYPAMMDIAEGIMWFIALKHFLPFLRSKQLSKKLANISKRNQKLRRGSISRGRT